MFKNLFGAKEDSSSAWTANAPVSGEAAICYGGDKPFAIEPVTLSALQPGEVGVRIVASGICHTDLAVRDQQLPVPLPVILGHEGAGVVEGVGEGVTSVKPGDRVILSFNSCGSCANCEADAPTYCFEFFPYNWTGARPDGSATVFQDDQPMNAHFFGQSSFATRAIATERNVIKVPDAAANVPLERLAPLGCGMMTGAGAVLNALQAPAGRPLVVFGAGSVGMAAIMAAKIVGAAPIIAVDINDQRLELARELGASHTFNARDNAIDQIKELCPTGVACAFDTTGLKAVIQDAFDLLAPKGRLGMVGASDPADMLEFNETSFMGGGRTVMGILGGDSDIHTFLPRLIEHHLAGEFPFERLITFFDFAQINEAIEASEQGGVVKPVLRMPEG